MALALTGCVHSRWSAKTLADGIPLAAPSNRATIPQMLAMPRPPGVDWPEAHRVPAETRVYTIQARLLRFKLASDGDVHLAIADPKDIRITMIAEIPDPSRMRGTPASYVTQVARTRAAFVKRFGAPQRDWRDAGNALIEVTGPAFFDLIHGQVGGMFGGAPSGVELHPVLNLRLIGKGNP